MTVPTMDPVVVSVFVKADAERAFDAFTAEMTNWWPLAEISISKPERVVVEARQGGEIYEVNARREPPLGVDHGLGAAATGSRSSGRSTRRPRHRRRGRRRSCRRPRGRG